MEKNRQVDIKNDKLTIKKQTKRNEDEQTNIQKEREKMTNRENDEQRNG